MDRAVIAGAKTEDIKSKVDPLRLVDVAISRGEKLVSPYPEIKGTAVLPRKRYMSRRILRILEVIVEGLFSGKCDSCHYWRCCPAQREPGSERTGKGQISSNEKIPPVPSWIGWERLIRSEPMIAAFSLTRF